MSWTYRTGEIAELKIANGQSIIWIAKLKNAKKAFLDLKWGIKDFKTT